MRTLETEKLNELYELCRKASVSFDILYSESEDGWEVSVSSPAPSENNTSGGKLPFEYAIQKMIDFVRLEVLKE